MFNNLFKKFFSLIILEFNSSILYCSILFSIKSKNLCFGYFVFSKQSSQLCLKQVSQKYSYGLLYVLHFKFISDTFLEIYPFFQNNYHI